VYVFPGVIFFFYCDIYPLLLLLFILTASGFLPCENGTIRHNTQITHIIQNNTTLKKNTTHKTNYTNNKRHTTDNEYNTNTITTTII
jgi:hypothetical protein